VMVRDASSGDDDRGDAPPTTEPAPATQAEVEEVVTEISAFVEKKTGFDGSRTLIHSGFFD